MTRRATLLSVVALVLALAAIMWWLHPWHGRVPMPADDASPAEVVRAYVEAVHVDDCGTAERLAPGTGSTWCDADLTDLAITSTTQEPREVETGTGPMATRVNATFVLHGGDGSMPDGPHDWSYLLDRTGPNGAWRIYSQGMG